MTLSESVAKARHEADADAHPRIGRALSAWPVRITEIELAGLSCQVVEPNDGECRSTLLYFFGGGYVTGSPENDLSITAPLASLGSMRVIAPRYGLAPEHPFPIAKAGWLSPFCGKRRMKHCRCQCASPCCRRGATYARKQPPTQKESTTRCWMLSLFGSMRRRISKVPRPRTLTPRRYSHPLVPTGQKRS